MTSSISGGGYLFIWAFVLAAERTKELLLYHPKSVSLVSRIMQVDVYTEPEPMSKDVQLRIFSNPICPYVQVSGCASKGTVYHKLSGMKWLHGIWLVWVDLLVSKILSEMQDIGYTVFIFSVTRLQNTLLMFKYPNE